MKTCTSFAVLLLLLAVLHNADAQGTTFTYQGRLNDGANPANGSYDLRFILYTADPGGSQVGPILTNTAVAVSGGLFTVTLDFGASIFTNTDRFLEIAVRTNGGGGFATLSPRQKLTPTPYALFAENVAIGGLTAGTYGNAVTFNNAANSFSGSGVGLTTLNASQLTSGTVPDARLSASIARTNQVWQIGGNAGTSSDFIGTTDNQPFDVRVNNVRTMRFRLGTDASGFYTNAPNEIGGSSVNSALTTIVGATIAGGGGNFFNGVEYANKVTANFGTVGGGAINIASEEWATVGGGVGNSASGSATVSGGANNSAAGSAGVVGGGSRNAASGSVSTVSGGSGNTASGNSSTVSGGSDNTSGGAYSTVPGGLDNAATSDYSFAAGHRAKADNMGSFVWADASNFDFHSAVTHQFAVRCTGGAKFVTAIDGTGAQTAGVRLLAGDTAWSSISDRNAKKNFTSVNAEAVLEKLTAMPVQSWNYKWESDDSVPHLGPMAQDFKTAFYPGRDDKSISTLEFDGVELAAIQGLNQRLQKDAKEKDGRIGELEKELLELKAAVKQLSGKKD